MYVKRLFRSMVTGCVVVVTALTVQAQDAQKKGFDYADKEKKKAAPGVVVLKDDEAHHVKIWKLEAAGIRSIKHPAIGPIVEDVTLYSNGRMRFRFVLRNFADNDEAINMNFDRSYMVDPDAESYKPLDRDIIPEARGGRNLVFAAGTKTRFWLEFDAPKKPTTKFKILLATDPSAGYATIHNEFPPFIITLKEPISANLKVKAEEAEKTEDGAAVVDGTTTTKKSTGLPRGGMIGGPSKGSAPASTISPKPLALMRTMIKKSERFEGEVRTAQGTAETGVLLLSPDPEDEDGVHAELSTKRDPLNKVELQGWAMTDPANAAIVQLKFKGKAGSYKFTFDGKQLSGTGPDGSSYTLRQAGK